MEHTVKTVNDIYSSKIYKMLNTVVRFISINIQIKAVHFYLG